MKRTNRRRSGNIGNFEWALDALDVDICSIHTMTAKPIRPMSPLTDVCGLSDSGTSKRQLEESTIRT